MKETRKGKIQVSKSGGTATSGFTYKAPVPTTWLKQIGIDSTYRHAWFEKEGNKIIITIRDSVEVCLNGETVEMPIKRIAAAHENLIEHVDESISQNIKATSIEDFWIQYYDKIGPERFAILLERARV
jgi:hypothetical protein